MEKEAEKNGPENGEDYMLWINLHLHNYHGTGVQTEQKGFHHVKPRYIWIAPFRYISRP